MQSGSIDFQIGIGRLEIEILDGESGKITAQPRPAGDGTVNTEGLNEQELMKYPAIYDFINTLDLDDFGKKKS